MDIEGCRNSKSAGTRPQCPPILIADEKMGNDCSSLHGDADPCQIAACVQSMQGLPSNSASPTDTFIVTLKNHVVYKGVAVKRAFLKIWVTRPIVPASQAAIEALNYEVKVYSRIIKPLIDSRVCPFFVKYIAGSLNCTYDNLLALYRLAMPPETSRATLDEHIERNLSYMLSLSRDRPALQDVSNKAYIKRVDLSQVKEQYRFAFLINEVVLGGLTLAAFVEQKKYATDDELLTVLLQVAYACQALVLSKVGHMDLHLGNIFVKRLDRPTVARMKYVYANGAESCVDFAFSCQVYMYDFDHTYAALLGDNPLLQLPNLRFYNMTNELIDNRDIIKAFGSLLWRFSCVGRKPNAATNMSLRVMRALQQSISSSEYLQGALKRLFKTRDHFMSLPDGSPADKDVFAEFNSTAQILTNLMTKLGRTTDGSATIFFRLSERDFDEKTGQLKMAVASIG